MLAPMVAPECEEQISLASSLPGAYATHCEHANPEHLMSKKTVTVNRAPVLTLWASVVAERLGYDTAEALTLGKALAGLNAQAKGRSLGIFKAPKTVEGKPPKKRGLGEEFWIELCGRPIPAINTAGGIRAVVKDKPINPESVQAYLLKSFGDDLDAVSKAMHQLARSFPPKRLAQTAFSLYEKFRPQIAPGKRGWGQKGTLDLSRIRDQSPRTH